MRRFDGSKSLGNVIMLVEISLDYRENTFDRIIPRRVWRHE
jgi:hypothetical protein